MTVYDSEIYAGKYQRIHQSTSFTSLTRHPQFSILSFFYAAVLIFLAISGSYE